MNGTLIPDTAKLLDCSTRQLFDRAAAWKNFSNHEQVSSYRFIRYDKFQEVPPWLIDYCEHQWHGIVKIVGEEVMSI